MSTRTSKPTRFLTQPSKRLYDELHRGTDVWTFFNPSVFPEAVNLGQGFMNWRPPTFVLEQLQKEMMERTDIHHYSPARGRPRLLKAISDTFSQSFHKPNAVGEAKMKEGIVDLDAQGLPKQRPVSDARLDPTSEIVVTAGANEAMYCATTAFLEEGDEVVLMEPFFDQYVCETTFNGGTPIYVPILPPQSGRHAHDTQEKPLAVSANEWTFDWVALEEKLASPKAKMLFLNTPHNPIGKVCTLEELQRLAQLCIKHDILVIADEVYDCLTYEGHKHIRIASISGMWERTITVGSAGKSFACTGWRVGWAVGPAHLMTPLLAAHVRLTFCVNSLASEGTAIALEGARTNGFFERQCLEYEGRRQELTNMLEDVGLPYTIPYGSYFVLVDATNIQIPDDFAMPEQVRAKPRDYQVCWFIGKVCDVVAIPATAFYSSDGSAVGERFIRFAFCKDGQIREAAQRLQRVRPQQLV